ncbi:hypothetical protein ACWENQ_42800 [Nonomuraea sp. NPDC004354]
MVDIKKVVAGVTLAASALVVPMALAAQPASAATSYVMGGDDGGHGKRVEVHNEGGNLGHGNGGNANDAHDSDLPGGNGGSNNSGDINIGND